MTKKKKNKSRPFILFITGISGSGKTTVFEKFSKDLSLKASSIEFREIDEKKVPPVGRSHWRQYRVEELLYQAIKNLKKGKSTVICGITLPQEIINSRLYKPSFNIHFLLLDIPISLFSKRVKERIKKTKEEKNWEELKYSTKKLSTRLKNQVVSYKNGLVLDVGKKNVDEIFKDVFSLMRKLQK